eukprot:7383583-Prymnesium_polylepis.1
MRSRRRHRPEHKHCGRQGRCLESCTQLTGAEFGGGQSLRRKESELREEGVRAEGRELELREEGVRAEGRGKRS